MDKSSIKTLFWKILALTFAVNIVSINAYGSPSSGIMLNRGIYSNIVRLDTFDALYPYLKTEDAEQTSSVIWRMASISDSRVGYLLHEIWRTEKLEETSIAAFKDPKVKLAIAAALLEIKYGNSQEYIDYIYKNINNIDINLRSRAALALGEVGDQVAVQTLRKIIISDHVAVASSAISALQEIVMRLKPAHEAALKILANLSSSSTVTDSFIKNMIMQSYNEIVKTLQNDENTHNVAKEKNVLREFAEGEEAFLSGEDHVKALQLLKPYAVQGDMRAQYYIGEIYSIGIGVNHDYREAAKWLHMAAQQGHAGAQFSLANLYIAGQGVERDLSKGVNWLKKSAEQGYRNAQELLSEAYEKGWWGIPKDLSLANYWLQKTKRDRRFPHQRGQVLQ